MKLKFLIEISFILKNGEKDKRIVCGVKADYLMKNFNNLNLVHQDIIIKTQTGNFIFKVKKIDVFSSISGSFNIGFTLYDNANFHFLNVGDKIYNIINL